MLNKKTKALMNVVYKKAIQKDGVCLVNEISLLEDLSYKLDFRRDELEPSLKALMLEGYFEMIETTKKGEKYYCLTLLHAGYDFSRQIVAEQRAIKIKIIMTIVGAITTFIIGKILASLF